jgi:hypothetical protein
MTKALKKSGIEGMYYKIIKDLHNKSIVNILLMWKTETISAEVRNKTRLSTFSTHSI